MNTLQKTVSLKELREQFPKYIEAIAQGQSFTVVKRSKPIFQMGPVSDGQDWQTVADFAAIDGRGVAIDDILKALES